MSRRPLARRSRAQPSIAPDATPSEVSGRRRRWPRWAVLAIAAVLLSAWLGDAFGQLFRGLASRSLQDNRPHAALAWLRWAAISESLRPFPPDDSTPRLQALAFFRLNLREPAIAALEEAALRRGDARRLRFYHDLADAHHGNAASVERLTEYGGDYLPPPAVFESVIRHGMYHGQFDWAITIADMWIDQFPADGAAFYHRGRMHELSNRFDAAANDYQAALNLQAHLYQAAYRLGIVLKKSRQFEAAEYSLRQCLDSPCDAVARIEIADALWEQGKYDAAWGYVEPEVSRSPLEYADLYRQVDDFDDHDRTAVTAARILESQNRLAEAIPLWERALRFNSRNPEAYDALVAALRRIGRTEAADLYAARHAELLAMRRECAELRVRISDEPDDMEAKFRLAELYAQCESLASAHLVLREVLMAAPGHQRAQQLQADVFRQQAEAERAFSDSLDPQDTRQ